jgi:hypothetical protein
LLDQSHVGANSSSTASVIARRSCRAISVQPNVPPREIQVGGSSRAHAGSSTVIGAPHFEVKVEVGHIGGDVTLHEVKREIGKPLDEAAEEFLRALEGAY